MTYFKPDSMLARTIKFCFLALFCTLLQHASAQNGVSDRINQELDRAPSVAALERQAKEQMAIGDNYAAFRLYERLLDVDSLHPNAMQQYAAIATEIGALGLAEETYLRMLRHNIGEKTAVEFKVAEMRYLLGDYEGARVYYQRFLQNPEGNISKERQEAAEKGIEDCDWAISVKRNFHKEQGIQLLDSVVNSEYSEFSPIYHNGVLYYSSYRFPFDKDKKRPNRQLIKVLEAPFKNGDFAPTPALNINDPEAKRHTAHVTFNSKGNVMYYSLCDFVGQVEIRCEIFMRDLQSDGTWGTPQKLPEHINLPEFTNTEPNVGQIGTNQEILYFVSDRTGGAGKRDIWYSVISGKNFSQPENLKEVNTPADDVTPFYNAANQTFYYSTTGLQTLGGFDVYSVRMSGAKVDSDPVHLGMPINSSFNDVYYAPAANGQTVFMASNREGAQNLSEESCCYDIFKIDLKKPVFLAQSFIKGTNDSLQGVTMTLIEIAPDGSKNERTVTVSGSSQGFDVKPGHQYVLIGQKNHFLNDTIRFSTPKVMMEDQVEKVYLEPQKVKLLVTVLERVGKKTQPLLGTSAMFTDFGPVNGNKPTAPVASLPNGQSNQFSYDLDFDHTYNVGVSKSGYTSDSTGVISTANLSGSTTLYDTLYVERGLNFTALAFNDLTKDTLNGVTFRLYEIEGSKRKVEKTGYNPLSNKFETIISYEKRYMIVGTKPGFRRDSAVFVTNSSSLPPKEFQTIVKKLNLRPLDLELYLPIVLYFDNDEPDKRTLARTTAKEYRQSYLDYIRRKSDFISIYTAGMEPERARVETDTLENFFNKEVREQGWQRLMSFSEVLYDMMDQGDTIVLTLKGYASPRAGTQYNLNLTDRRVSSVYNHFLLFDGEQYRPFVESGQLSFVREPNGETKSHKGISDNIFDERNSVYSVPASRERRVEIIGVKVNDRRKK
jgi:tetratricopeptide (TPR) repeat protein